MKWTVHHTGKGVSKPSRPLNKDEIHRAQLVIRALKYVNSCTRAPFSKANKRRLAAILKMFEQRGHCLDAPRSGRPFTYTEEMMEAAVCKLVEHDQGLLSMKGLIRLLQADGTLPRVVDQPTFTAHLKAHVKRMGHQLIMNSQKTTFFLLKGDLAERRRYCEEMQQLLTTSCIEDLLFVDETQVAAAPHPKGRLPPEAAELATTPHSHPLVPQVACHVSPKACTCALG